MKASFVRLFVSGVFFPDVILRKDDKLIYAVGGGGGLDELASAGESHLSGFLVIKVFLHRSTRA